MFKKLKEKITEEVKSSPQRIQQFTQSVSDRLQNSAPSDENFFSIGDDDANASSASIEPGFSSVSLTSPQDNRYRRNSNSSIASDVSFLPRYELSSNSYHLQSDLDISASELEDNASTSSQLGHLTKEQLYSAFQKAQMRYHKYRGRYTDLARHYKDLERDNVKMKSVLVETQDKAIRRVTELKEQCGLEQKAKAHLESALRDELEEYKIKIQTLQTKVGLLQEGNTTDHLVELEKKENGVEGQNLEVLTKYLNDARKEIEVLNEKLQEMKANAIVLQSKEVEFKAKIGSLEKELMQFSEREKENNLKLAQSKMELHNEILSKDAEIANMKRDNEVLRLSLEQFETDGRSVKLENLQTQNKKLIERLENLTQKSNQLESEVLKVETYKMEIKQLQNSLDQLSLENEQVKEKLQVDQAELENLRNLNEKLQQNEESFNQEKEINEKRIETIREEAKKALLGIETKIKKTIQLEFEEKEQKLKEDFAQKLDQLTSNNNTLKETQIILLQKDEIIKNLTEELHGFRTDLNNKEQVYADLEQNHLQLIEETSKLRAVVANLEQEQSRVHLESLSAEEKVARLQANIDTMHLELSSSEKLNDKKEEVIVELSKNNLALEESLHELKHTVRLFEEKDDGKEINATECKLLEMKVQKLEQEQQSLLDEFEMERRMFNDIHKDNHELKEKEETLHELQVKYAQLEVEVAETNRELSVEVQDGRILHESKLELEQKLTKTLEQMRLLEEKLEAVELEKSECKLLELKLQTLENDKENLMQSFEFERVSFAKAYKLNAQLEDQIEQLGKEKKTLEDLVEEGAKKLEKMAKEKLANTKTIQNLTEKLENLNLENSSLQEEVAERQEQIASLSKRVDECHGVISTQTLDFNNLLGRCNQLEQVVVKLQQDNSKGSKEEQNKQNDLQLKLEACQSDLEEKSAQILDLSQKLTELDAKCNSGRNDLDKKTEEMESLQLKLQELKSLQERYQLLENEKQKQLEVLEAGNLQLKDLQAKNDLLVQNQNDLDNFRAKNELLSSEVLRLKSQLSELTLDKEKLDESGKVAVHLKLQNDSLQNDCDKLHKEISELQVRISQISADNSHVSDENQNLLATVEELKVKNEFLEQEKLQFANSKVILEEDKVQLSKTLENVTSELLASKSVTNANLSVGSDVEQIQKDFYEIKAKCDKLFSENKNLNAEYLQLEAKCNDLGQMKGQFETQISEMEHQYSDLMHEKQLLLEEVQELKTSPLNCQNKLENLEIVKQAKTFSTDAATNNDQSEKHSREIQSLRDKLTQYKSLDLTNKSSIEFYENELQKMKNSNEKLSRKLDETLVTLNHCAELSGSTEIEYLKNVLYNYMMGKEGLVLARVIAAVCKFDPSQTETIMQKEHQKQTLLGQLGIL